MSSVAPSPQGTPDLPDQTTLKANPQCASKPADLGPARHDGRKSGDAPPTGPRYVVLTGNPNCGKTTVFNALTGLRAKVGNYAGVTVERKEGKLLGGAGVP